VWGSAAPSTNPPSHHCQGHARKVSFENENQLARDRAAGVSNLLALMFLPPKQRAHEYSSAAGLSIRALRRRAAAIETSARDVPITLMSPVKARAARQWQKTEAPDESHPRSARAIRPIRCAAPPGRQRARSESARLRRVRADRQSEK
jgi:hypothetical protein